MSPLFGDEQNEEIVNMKGKETPVLSLFLTLHLTLTVNYPDHKH